MPEFIRHNQVQDYEDEPAPSAPCIYRYQKDPPKLVDIFSCKMDNDSSLMKNQAKFSDIYDYISPFKGKSVDKAALIKMTDIS